MSSLARDARELGDCVAYFKGLRPQGKIVLMGHSTGCQDAVEYLVGKGGVHEEGGRSGVDGVVLQGGVSDREAWADMLDNDEAKKGVFDGIVDKAKRLVDEGRGKEIMPREGNFVAEELGAPMSAYRTHSLLAHGGDDDYFSSDLSDDVFRRSLGHIPKSTPVCFLLGSEDPHVPGFVDKEALLKRWTGIIRGEGGVVDDVHGGVVSGAHHNLEGDEDEVVADLVARVCGFVKGLEAGARL